MLAALNRRCSLGSRAGNPGTFPAVLTSIRKWAEMRKQHTVSVDADGIRYTIAAD